MCSQIVVRRSFFYRRDTTFVLLYLFLLFVYHPDAADVSTLFSLISLFE